MPRDPLRFRQSLLQLLEAGSPHEERLLAEFEAHKEQGHPLYSSLLYILTHLSFSEAEAHRHWQRIVDHRDGLRRELGRDVGLRVAILDYFVNVNHELKSPKIIEIAIYERTERSAISDGLTGLFNHAYLLQALKREVQRSRRYRLKLSLVMLDLDDFKQINDSRGHLEGDRVLMRVAALVQESLREIDVAARYGGEEFALVLPDTNRAGAYIVADRIRRRVEEQFKKKGRRPVTLSGGVATYPEDATTPEDLVRRADEGLYRSKADGKNRVTLAEGERRRHARVPTNHPVTVRAKAGRHAPARAKNVSEGGCLVSLKEPVPLGSSVSVVIRPAGGPPMGLRGEVVRADRAPGRTAHYDVGVRFLSEPSQALLVLRRLGTPQSQA